MKKLIFGAIAVLALCGGALAVLTVQEFVQRDEAADALVATESEDGGMASIDPSADDDAGQDDGPDASVDPLWDVNLGDEQASWNEVGRTQQGGKDGHLYERTGAGMQLMVVVMDPSTEDPAMELIEKLWDETQRTGLVTDAIDMVSYGDHTWVGYQCHGTIEDVSMTGMTYASIDTTSRGAKLLILGIWPDTENDASSALFHKVLEHVTVQRQE